MPLAFIEPLAMALTADTLHKVRRVSKHWRDACGCAWAALRALVAELRRHQLAWRSVDREPWAFDNWIAMHNRQASVIAVGDIFNFYTVLESGEIVFVPSNINNRKDITVHWHRRPTPLYKSLRLWLAFYNTETYVIWMLLDGKCSFVTTNDMAHCEHIERQLTFPDSRDPRFVYFVVVPVVGHPLHVCHIDVKRGVGVWTHVSYRPSGGYGLVRPGSLTYYNPHFKRDRIIEF